MIFLVKAFKIYLKKCIIDSEKEEEKVVTLVKRTFCYRVTLLFTEESI